MIQALAAFEGITDQVKIGLPELERALFAERPKAFACMAFQEHKAVGYVLLVPCPYVKRGQEKLVIEDFYVDDSCRGHGIGRHLMQAAMDFARQHKYFRLEWGVYEWNEAAHRFYQSLGAKPGITLYQLQP